jgi:hypothetical protein
MGAWAGATGSYCTAIGNRAYAGGDIQFAIGASGTAPGAVGEAGANNNALVILKNGNVGIGTDAPTFKLDVDGDALINGLTVGTGNSNFASNTAFGVDTLKDNISGGQNVAVGNQTLTKLIGGEGNTAIGYRAGFEVTSGDNNTIIGINAGPGITTGNNNTIIGNTTNTYSPNGDNNIIIGYGASADIVLSGNQIRLGNTSISYAGIEVSWAVTSDERIKSDIQNSNLGLNFINKLHPVSYYRNNDKSKKKEYGFIAQEIDTVLNNAGVSNNGIISKNNAGIYSVRYNDLIAPMVKAIQQQQEMINTLQQEIKSLNKK